MTLMNSRKNHLNVSKVLTLLGRAQQGLGVPWEPRSNGVCLPGQASEAGPIPPPQAGSRADQGQLWPQTLGTSLGMGTGHGHADPSIHQSLNGGQDQQRL